MQVDVDPDGKAALSACFALGFRPWDLSGFARALLESDQQRSGDCFRNGRAVVRSRVQNGFL